MKKRAQKHKLSIPNALNPDVNYEFGSDHIVDEDLPSNVDQMCEYLGKQFHD